MAKVKLNPAVTQEVSPATITLELSLDEAALLGNLLENTSRVAYDELQYKSGNIFDVRGNVSDVMQQVYNPLDDALSAGGRRVR